MSLALKVLVALIIGFGAGLAIAAANPAGAATIANAIGPVGTLWVAAIRMAIIPLIVSSLLLGVGGATDTKTVTMLGLRGLALFLTILAIAAGVTILVAPPLFSGVEVTEAASAALRASAGAASQGAVEGAKQLPSASQWLIDLVPVNPIKAAADGALLPVIVFSIAIGAAITRIATDRRAALLGLMGAVQEASLVVMRVVLALAPAGVFALSFVLATKLGKSAAGAIGIYIVVYCGLSTAFCLLVLYPAAAVFGGVRITEFARAIVPAQAVAFSSRSSMAAFPAMLAVGRDRLKLSESVNGFLLPLVVTVFRVGGVIAQLVGAIFVARLYNVNLGAAQLATMAVTSIAASFTVPGIPGGSIIVMVPVLLSGGVPPEGVGVLLAVDTIPDMFRTTTNVTGDLTAAVILDRFARTATIEKAPA